MGNSKWEMGAKIASMDECLKHDIIILRHKAYHIGWVKGWQVNYLYENIKAGRVYLAIPAWAVEWHTGKPELCEEDDDGCKQSESCILKTSGGEILVGYLTGNGEWNLPFNMRRYKNEITHWTEYSMAKWKMLKEGVLNG